VVGYPSGQRGQTVNLLAYAFTGSNPVPTTTAFGTSFFEAGPCDQGFISGFGGSERPNQPRLSRPRGQTILAIPAHPARLVLVAREYHLNSTAEPQTLRIDYRGELNDQQYAAVSAPNGPALVLAGAGAGKTRTLTYRVAWLLEHGTSPDRILLLTFTNKSAREMMQRVGELLPGDLGQLWGGTFHSIGLRLLRRHPDRLGYQPGFTVADREDAEDLLESCIADAGIDVKATRFPKAEVLAEVFSMAANTGRSVSEELERNHSSFVPLIDSIQRIHQAYAERKRRAGLMDFDDLLTLWLRLLREHSDVAEVYQRRFQHILVDEYQDTNWLQSELLDTLARRHGNLMAVGDDAQSIYSWRGANFANILDFPKRRPNARVFKVETNYRSTPEILALANAVIAHNARQFPKALQAARPTGPKPALVVTTDTRDQAAFVAQRALELRDEGVPLKEMCVLYRSHFHALELQLELVRRNIPFVITSGIRFFEQAHIKDVTAYLKLIHNPADELAFKRLVRLLPGIGGKGAEKLWSTFATSLRDLLPVLEAPVPPGPSAEVAPGMASDNDGALPEEPEPAAAPVPVVPVAPILRALTKTVPKKAADGWQRLVKTLAEAESASLRDAPGACLRHVLAAEYAEHLEVAYENARKRREEIEQLAEYADQFRSGTEFLSQLALQTNLEAEQDKRRNSPENDDERLRLSTVHQSKGLEYAAVFVIMLCDGLFPSARSAETLDGEEEERRLFYVAVTRAKNELYLCRPLLRFMPGGGDAMQMPSRFLEEIPADLLEEINVVSAGRFNAGSRPVVADDFIDDAVHPDAPDDSEPF